MAGNANSGRKQEKPFRDALRMELAAAGTDMFALRAIARALMDKAIGGEGWAIKELADRTDGKVPQSIIGGDEGDNPVSVITRIELVAPSVDGQG
jgi:hypothetical protein